MFMFSISEVKNILAPAKPEYYNNMMNTCKGNQRTVYTAANKVLHQRQTVFQNMINSDTDIALMTSYERMSGCSYKSDYKDM